MKPRVVVLGAGFGGLELTSILSETFGDELDVVLLDQADSFVFGFAKLDVMFGRKRPEDVRFHYARIAKPGTPNAFTLPLVPCPATSAPLSDVRKAASGAVFPGAGVGWNSWDTVLEAVPAVSLVP